MEAFVIIDGIQHPVFSGFVRSALDAALEAELVMATVASGLCRGMPVRLQVGRRTLTLRLHDAQAAGIGQSRLVLWDPAWLTDPAAPGANQSLLTTSGGDKTITLGTALTGWGIDCAPDAPFERAERGWGCTMPKDLLDLVSREQRLHFWRDERGARIGMPSAAVPIEIDVTLAAPPGLLSTSVEAHCAGLVVAGDSVGSVGDGAIRGIVLSALLTLDVGAKTRVRAVVGEPPRRVKRLSPTGDVAAMVASLKPFEVTLDGYAASPVAAMVMLDSSDQRRYLKRLKLAKSDRVTARVPTEGWAGPIEVWPVEGTVDVARFAMKIPAADFDVAAAVIRTKGGIDVEDAN